MKVDLGRYDTDLLAPTIAELFKPGELDKVDLRRTSDGAMVRFFVGQEVFTCPIFTRGVESSEADLRDHVYDQIQDQVAESSFAWGEQRGRMSLDSLHD